MNGGRIRARLSSLAHDILIGSLVLMVAVSAAAAPAQVSAPGAIKAVEGVYKSRFANADVQGDHFESEDILEIVPYGTDKIYFRIHLEFYNAHLCNLYGIATYENGSFVYNASSDDAENSCTLRITPQKEKLVLDDAGGNCSAMTCGARGGYRGAGFPLRSRRTIRYRKRIEASREYAEAVAEFQKRRPAH